MIFHRGKYKGRHVAEVPTQYLSFVLEHPAADRETKKACAMEIAQRFGVPTYEQIVYRDRAGGGVDQNKIKAWYRKASIAAHPDHGGSARMMKLLNELMDMVG